MIERLGAIQGRPKMSYLESSMGMLYLHFAILGVPRPRCVQVVADPIRKPNWEDNHRPIEILMRKGIRPTLTNMIANASPIVDWGIEYGPSPNTGTLVPNDFFPWRATKLGEFRPNGGKSKPAVNRRLVSTWPMLPWGSIIDSLGWCMEKNALANAKKIGESPLS